MSNVQITYDGTDITSSVIFSDATFEQQMNAVPGTCRVRVKDPDQTLSFVTGKELRLYVNDVPMWGGYLRRVTYGFPFSADDTSDPEDYINRIWSLEGADYNILWDNLVLRRDADYTTHVPNNAGYAKDTDDGWAIWKMLHSFSDFPSGFGITATRADAEFIDDIREVLPASATTNFYYKDQSTTLRAQMDDLAKMAGATFYISADKRVHYHAYENVIKKWGFSDTPNYVPISASPADFQDSTWGFHEVSAEEDGSMLVTDALIWGGSPLGSNGDVIFARYQDEVDDVDSTSTTYIQNGNIVADSPLDVHGRWQVGEVHTEGGMFGNLDGVKARANVIINGPSGTSVKGDTKGLSRPIWTFQFNWRAWQVPELSGVHNHIVAGEIVYIELATFGVSEYAPCRTIRISFEDLDPSGNSLDDPGDAYAIFTGEFSFSYTDSTSLWKTLIKANRDSGSVYVTPSVTTVDDSSTSADYGAFGFVEAIPATDGVETVFELPNDIGYIGGTLEVFLNGLPQRPGVDFDETSTVGGTFTMSEAPISTDTILVQFRALAT